MNNQGSFYIYHIIIGDREINVSGGPREGTNLIDLGYKLVPCHFVWGGHQIAIIVR